MRDQAFEMGEATGCTTSDSATLVECLRQQDANELLAKSIEVFNDIHFNLSLNHKKVINFI